MNIQNIRSYQFAQLENNLKTYDALVPLLGIDRTIRYRDGGTGWTPLQTLCHLRDFERVFIDRARTTVEQEQGSLPFPNPDALAAERGYEDEDVSSVMAAWKANRAEHIAYLRERSEDDWLRVGIHPRRGPLTLLDQVCLVPQHDSLHLEQIARTLREKRTE